MFEKNIGVFNHYLDRFQNNPAKEQSFGIEKPWNEHVKDFDVERLAYNLNEIGASYYFITLMQGTPHMIAPNETFDKIAGTKKGEACSERDLPTEIFYALEKYGIELGLYYTGDGPYIDPVIGRKFGFYEPREEMSVNYDFVSRWASVLKEYSERYAGMVKAWWIDGCYDEFFGYTQELMELLYNAAKAGNKNALVTCNNGVKDTLYRYYKDEDFTSGEENDFKIIPKSKYTGKSVSHMLIPLGKGIENDEYSAWGEIGCKRDREYMKKYVNEIRRVGAALTVDIAVFRDGSFAKDQMETLKYAIKGE